MAGARPRRFAVGWRGAGRRLSSRTRCTASRASTPSSPRRCRAGARADARRPRSSPGATAGSSPWRRPRRPTARVDAAIVGLLFRGGLAPRRGRGARLGRRIGGRGTRGHERCGRPGRRLSSGVARRQNGAMLDGLHRIEKLGHFFRAEHHRQGSAPFRLGDHVVEGPVLLERDVIEEPERR